MKVGFTGTRQGMTTEQRTALRSLLSRLSPDEWRHGACVGADEDGVVEVVSWERAVSRLRCRIIAMPGRPANDLTSDNVKMCSKQALRLSDLRVDPTGHFARNRRIVDESDVLVACPPSMEELSTGGTWYTINYARKQGKPIFILWPDGMAKGERLEATTP